MKTEFKTAPSQNDPAPTGQNLVSSRIGFALRESLRAGYSRRQLGQDLVAGIIVGIVAIPLSMALAIASGAPPQNGLYTAIIAGGLAALLGGSRVQVSGPTAAFVVILAPITAQYGLGGLFVATALAGGMLLLMGVTGMGHYIEFIPYPVTIGFTAGIAVVIAILQIKDFFGLEIVALPDSFLEKVMTIIRHLPTARGTECGVAALTLLTLVGWPKITGRIPAPFVALILASLAGALIAHFWPENAVATISSRFSFFEDGVWGHGIPQTPPHFAWPWGYPGANGEPFNLSFGLIESLLPAAFAIAMLSGIESLLSAVVADGMTGQKHDPDAELAGMGIANIIAPFFGGFAATGAIARTATNVRAGGRSPVASFTHAIFILIATLSFAPLLGFVPMSAMAALLIVVAYNMSEFRHVIHAIRVAPRSDTVVMLSCITLTVVFDMVVAVVAGIILAAMLFMKRMASVSGVKLLDHTDANLSEPLPPGVMLYEVAGPFFFGSAQRAMSALKSIHSSATIILLDMRAVPAMDHTGLVALESALLDLRKSNCVVIIAGVREQPAELLERAGIISDEKWRFVTPDFLSGVARARQVSAGACNAKSTPSV